LRKKNLSKILVSICLTLVLALSLSTLLGCGGKTVYKIGISQIVTHPALDATREGIIAGLAEKGYV